MDVLQIGFLIIFLSVLVLDRKAFTSAEQDGWLSIMNEKLYSHTIRRFIIYYISFWGYIFLNLFLFGEYTDSWNSLDYETTLQLVLFGVIQIITTLLWTYNRKLIPKNQHTIIDKIESSSILSLDCLKELSNSALRLKDWNPDDLDNCMAFIQGNDLSVECTDQILWNVFFDKYEDISRIEEISFDSKRESYSISKKRIIECDDAMSLTFQMSLERWKKKNSV